MITYEIIRIVELKYELFKVFGEIPYIISGTQAVFKYNDTLYVVVAKPDDSFELSEIINGSVWSVTICWSCAEAIDLLKEAVK